MKKLFTLMLLAGLYVQVSAQLPANSIAPDFTATDINGVEYHLYDIIEQGKPVIMDVSATWCGPCWSYHNAHHLKTVYEQYGPNGTNELMVMFVEGDNNTSLECLYGTAGCTGGTQGNWVADTPYPIFNNGDIAQAYEIAYYPTVYLICPNHLVKEIGQQNAAALKASADACPDPVQGVNINAITFGTDYQYGRICGTQVVTPSYLVLNGGTETLTSVVIEVKVNGATVQTLDYTEPIPSFMPRMIEFAPIEVTGSAIIRATIKSLNGVELATPIVKQKTYQKAKTTLTKELTLELKTDGYAVETYWELIDDQGNVYAYGGNENVGPNGASTGTPTAGPGTYSNNSVVTETVEVPANGCYFLHMVDAYGDGMCDGTNTGYFKLFETANTANILTEGGCDFADSYNIFGAEGIVGVNDLVQEGSFRVFPNPAKDVLRLEFSLQSAAEVQITVTNTLGQVIRTFGTFECVEGSNFQAIPTADLASGMYIVNLRTSEGTVSRTFSVKQ